mmetsp:Transcript_510/g.1221  ORF Transcript_510/g.1221 Transcript_510/m.1221 type:complete len:119 (-) Transcript_510:688-1044(-)
MSDAMEIDHGAKTIDPNELKSRIIQSDSLQKESQIDDDTNEEQPVFPRVSAMEARGGRTEYRRIRCPPHRYTPLRENWEQILTPLVEYLKLQASSQHGRVLGVKDDDTSAQMMTFAMK